MTRPISPDALLQQNITQAVVIKDKMFVFRMTQFDKATNTTRLTLYKNPDEHQADKPLKEMEVANWR